MISKRKGPLRIVIIGCGVSGISLTLELIQEFDKRRYVKGRDYTLVIYEREESPGGTWKVNRYPGCACDVPVHYYSLSTEPRTDWSNVYAGQEEIENYWDDIYERHHIDRFVELGTTFVSSRWSNETQSHTITLDSKGKTFEDECELLVSCIGGFSCASKPDLGEGFNGISFHSTKWPKDKEICETMGLKVENVKNPKIDWMSGKKVGIIGSGSTACQIVPTIVNVKDIEVHQFVRTPNWVTPRMIGVGFILPFWRLSGGRLPLPINQDYSWISQFLFRWIPGLRWFHRFMIYFFTHEIAWIALRRKGDAMNNSLREGWTYFMKYYMPKKYWNDLIPTFEPGCKRTIIDPIGTGYLSALWKPNMNVHRVQKVNVVEQGVKLSDDRIIDLDIIVYATGFSVAKEGLTMDIGGRNEALPSYWETRGGPEAYLGVLVPSFPNFVSTVGPNSVTGHQSVIAFVECQITYIKQLVLAMFDKDIGSFEIKDSICKGYNDMLKPRLEKSAINGNCLSWYKTKGQKKITTAWPGTLAEFWWRTRKVNWKELEVTPVTVK